MVTLPELLGLIDHAYAAACHGRWNDLLDALARSFGRGQAILLEYDALTGVPRSLALLGVQPPCRCDFDAVVSKPDMAQVWSRGMSAAASGTTAIERYAVDPELNRTGLYQEWLRPQRITEALETCALVTPRSMAMLGVARTEGTADFDGDAVAALHLLQPHVIRALQLHRRLGRLELERRQALDALDRLDEGVVLVDARGRVQHASRAAQALLGAGLRLRQGVLACDTADDTRWLHRLIAAAAATSTAAPGAPLAVRRTGRRPLAVMVAPLRHADVPLREPAAAVIVIVTDPERARPADEAALAQLYGLTPGEARVALAVLAGDRLADVARKLSVSLSTVRTLLQRAFEKTGTHRQADLVRLLLAHRLPRGTVRTGQSQST